MRNQLPNRFRPRSCGRALALATGEGRPAKLPGFDGQGWIQAIGGLVIGLIALSSSFDHVYLLSHRITLHRQWGVWFIVASLAVAKLRQLNARGRELLSSELNRSRLNAFLALLAEQAAAALDAQHALVLNVPLNHDLNHRFFEVMGSGVEALTLQGSSGA